MIVRFVVARDVTPDECPWLDKTVPNGTVVYRYDGHTYGCISPKGVAVSYFLDVTPFFELPNEALEGLVVG